MRRLLRNLLWSAGMGSLAVLTTSALLVQVSRADDGMRKVVARTAPSYPELAKKMHLTGKVKVEVTVNPAGSVTSAKLVGGNPVFESSAVDTVKQWKFEASTAVTKELVVLEFAGP